MADLRWFPFDARGWLGSAAITLMSPEQEGAYIHVLAAMWDDGTREPCLPDDDTILARVSRLGDRWASEGAAVRAQFVIRNDRVYSPPLSEMWARQSERYERRALAGRKGNDAKRDALRDALPDAKRTAKGDALRPAKRSAKRSALRSQSVTEVELEVELDSKRTQSSEELLRTHYFAPEGARARENAALAAPGADVPPATDNGAPLTDSPPGRAVVSGAASLGVTSDVAIERPVDLEPRSGNGPTTIADMLDMLRPSRKSAIAPALAKGDTAGEEREALAWVDAAPDVRERVIAHVAEEWGERLPNTPQGDAALKRIWKSACIAEYRKRDTTAPANAAGEAIASEGGSNAVVG